MNFFEGWKLEVCFCPSYLHLNALIGYVDFSYFNETWHECTSDINTSNCVRLKRNSKYFFVTFQHISTTKTIYIVQLRSGFSQEPIQILRKPHTLCYPLSPEWYSPVCLDVSGITWAGNSMKQTQSVSSSKACVCIPKQKWLKILLFLQSVSY